MKFQFIFLFIFFGLNLIFSSIISAEIIINEIMPNSSTGQEWIELYNNSTQDASLSGYLLEDQLTSPSIIYEFSNEIILGNQYLVIDLDSMKLNNSGDGVILYDNNGAIIDETSYINAPNDLSWSRLNDNSFEFLEPTRNLANLELVSMPTPTSILTSTPTQTPIPTLTLTIAPTPTPINFDFSQIEISEFVACALTDHSEWVEFYNNSDQDLEGFEFILENQNGTQKNFNNIVLNSSEYKSVDITSSFLTNAGGEFKLIINGEIREIIAYPKCEKGKSFIRINDGWLETDQVTKDQKNILINSSHSESSSSSLSSNKDTNSSGNENDSFNEIENMTSQLVKEIDYQLPSLNLKSQKLSNFKNFSSSSQFPEEASQEIILNSKKDLIFGLNYSKLIGVIIFGLVLLASGFLGLYVIFIKEKEAEQIY